MRKIAVAGFVVALLAGTAECKAQEPPKAPKGQEWLQQLVGEWESEAEVVMEPGKPPVKNKGTESVRAIGGWIIAENKAAFMDTPFTGILTVGYDAEKKKYLGTWVDSMTSHLWIYDGTLDAAGKALSLEATGPNPMVPGKLFKYKDVIEIKSKDHKVLTSSMQGEDGKWVSFLTINYRRKK